MCNRGGCLDSGHILGVWRCSCAVTEDGFWPSFISVVTIRCACSVVPDSCDPMDCSHKAPLSMGFFRQEYCSELPFPTPGDLPDPGTEPLSPVSPALAGRFFTIEPHTKPLLTIIYILIFWKKTISCQYFLPAKSLAPASTLEWGLIFKVWCYHYHRPLWTPTLATALSANGMRKTTCHLRVAFFFFFFKVHSLAWSLYSSQ